MGPIFTLAVIVALLAVIVMRLRASRAAQRDSLSGESFDANGVDGDSGSDAARHNLLFGHGSDSVDSGSHDDASGGWDSGGDAAGGGDSGAGGGDSGGGDGGGGGSD